MRACTFKAINKIIANPTIVAAVGLAIVDVEFTVTSLKSNRAFTAVRSDQVFADSSILAWVGGALINFFLAITACEPGCTDAFVAVGPIIGVATVTSVLAERVS